MKVTSDYDTDAHFAAYRTYEWTSPSQQSTGDPRLDNPFLDSRIRGAVEKQLADKGFMKDSAGRPDLLVVYHTAVRGKLDVTSVSNYTYGPRWGYYGGVPGGTTYVREYDEGSLILDLIDASTRQLVWRGSAQAEIKENAGPREKQERINEAVRKIMKRFPPK